MLINLATLLALSACTTEARRSEPLGNPVTLTSNAQRHGQRIYMENCYPCHLGGEGGMAPTLTNKPLPGFLMKTQVRLGLGKMPGFDRDKISDDDLDNLVAYLKAVRESEPAPEPRTAISH